MLESISPHPTEKEGGRIDYPVPKTVLLHTEKRRRFCSGISKKLSNIQPREDRKVRQFFKFSVECSPALRRNSGYFVQCLSEEDLLPDIQPRETGKLNRFLLPFPENQKTVPAKAAETVEKRVE